jgi:hypothetical protein
MAHPEMEAVEVTDVNSAAQAISQMDEIFNEEENTEETSDEITEETQEEEITEAEQVEPEEQAIEEEAEETQEEELEEAIQAPVSWSSEHKDIFAKLPPEAQEVIHLRESQRDKAFQDKSTEIAEMRKATEADLQRIEQERQAYVQTLDMLAQQSLPPKPNMELLNPQSSSYNPEQYHIEKAQHEQGLEYQQGLRQEQARVAQEQQAVQNQRFTEYVQEQDRILTEQMPEWSVPETKKNIVDYASKQGYQPEQLKQASALDIQLLNKAMKYDKLMAEKPAVQQKVKTVPKVTKPGSVTSKNSKFEAKQAKFNKLRNSGRVEDAASVLRDLI